MRAFIEKTLLKTGSWHRTRLGIQTTPCVFLCFTKENAVEFIIRNHLVRKNAQFLIERLEGMNNFDCFKAHHLFMKLNALQGGQPWIVNEIVESNPIVVASLNLKCLREGRYMLSFTYSWNKFYTKYITKLKLITDVAAPGLEESMHEFFARCSKSMLAKLNLASLEFSCLFYQFFVDSKEFTSSFDKFAQFQAKRKFEEEKSALRELIKKTVHSFGAKALIMVDVVERKELTIFPPSSSTDKIDHTKSTYYTDFEHFNQSRGLLFGSSELSGRA